MDTLEVVRKFSWSFAEWHIPVHSILYLFYNFGLYRLYFLSTTPHMIFALKSQYLFLIGDINDFLFRAKFSYSKLVKRGYKHSLQLKYFKRFCSAYNIEGKYGEKNSDLLFSGMLKHNPFVSCNMNNIQEINDIVKSIYVKIMPLTRSLECEWTKKSPLPTNAYDTVKPPAPLLTHWI